MDRLVILLQTIGTNSSVKVRPKCLGPGIEGPFKFGGGTLEVSGTEQRASQRVMLPGCARDELGRTAGGVLGQLGPPQRLGMYLAFAIEDLARPEYGLRF